MDVIDATSNYKMNLCNVISPFADKDLESLTPFDRIIFSKINFKYLTSLVSFAIICHAIQSSHS